MNFIIEKSTEFSQDIFNELFTASTPYLAESLKIDVYTGSEFDDEEIRTRIENRLEKLRDLLHHMMAGFPTQIIIKNAADGRIQSMMAGSVNFAGTFLSPYTLHQPDAEGSRAYLYKSQTEHAVNLEAAFNTVGINNVRVTSGSDSQTRHALATGWVQEESTTVNKPDGVNAITTFRTPWGWA